MILAHSVSFKLHTSYKDAIIIISNLTDEKLRFRNIKLLGQSDKTSKGWSWELDNLSWLLKTHALAFKQTENTEAQRE